ncbi:MAG: exodeoxyribonuclease VII large subunit [Candidatus Andeanibacterium colombiense]|uniref:Exodeoxyribonuclease 7 large subunit n=1 Tax=Candidatus Andeanibacterium colombiense TaxID=3121345 RepID=A0AAJ5X6H3_9SPHN|nr:MAG: exodeoxyribonuclease VII large subunit [Sphingomonadaceae bacterium]
MPGPSYDDDAVAGLVARGAPGDNAEPLSITEISAILKRTVEDRFGFVRLRGELSGVKLAASGHLYCRLKDEGAQIDGVMWRGGVQRLAFRPEDGIEVVASGKLTTYAGRSSYQIVIESMEIAGEGALLALLEKTKARLEAEGLFRPERKRPLPYLPKVIGVVTSPTGAVIRDILHRLEDRCPCHVLVWPVLVQGQGSAEQVANAVRGFSEMAEGGAIPRPDVVIVARGGGSIEDLWGFNEEIVVRAIAECSIPVISAVGHETDTTLADYAADRRAPTPTAAAEMAVPVRAELNATLAEFSARQKRAILRPVQLGRERLEARAQRLPKPEVLVAQAAQRLDDLGERLRRGLADRAGRAGTALQIASIKLAPALLGRELAMKRRQLETLERVLPQLDPRAPLRRGYVLVSDAAGQVVKSAADARKQTALILEFEDGKLEVAPGSGGAPAPKRAPKAGGSGPSGQAELF